MLLFLIIFYNRVVYYTLYCSNVYVLPRHIPGIHWANFYNIKIVKNIGIIFIHLLKLIPYVSYIVLCYVITKEITINYCMIENINDILYPLLKGGIIKMKLINGTSYLYPLKLKYFNGWIHINVFILMYLCIIIPILFIINNIIACILYILAFILIKAIYTNFWNKHIGFLLHKWQNRNKKQGQLKLYIDWIHKNYKYLLIKFIQIWIISFTIVSLNRNVVKFLFGVQTDNLISSLLIVILALPVSLLIINILVKKLKNEKLILNDFYIFNEFIIERVNLYRILYLISITIIYKKYYIYWITTISIIIPIIIMILTLLFIHWIVQKKVWKYCNSKWTNFNLSLSKHNKIGEYNSRKLSLNLESQSDSFTVAISSIIGVGGVFQKACNDGLIDFYNGNKGPGWKKIHFSNPGKYYSNGTVNILHKPQNYVQTTEYDSIIAKHEAYINKSPILKITHRQKKAIDWVVVPHSYFSNETVYGSVVRVKKHNFFIINIIRKDWDACVFMPSYYLPLDRSNGSQVKIDEVQNFFVRKYNIMLPIQKTAKEKPRTGFIVFTQAESINTGGPSSGLFRHWRPFLGYVDTEFLVKRPNVKDYYHLDKLSHLRVKGYNNQEIIMKLKTYIAKYLTLSSLNDRIIYECKVDLDYTKMLYYFLLKGQKCNKDKYFWFQEGKWENICKREKELNELFKREGASPTWIEKAIQESKEKQEAKDKKVELQRKQKLEEIKKLEAKDRSDNQLDVELVSYDLLVEDMKNFRLTVKKHDYNNNSASSRADDLVLSLRRSYPKDYSIWNHELDYCFYLRTARTGLIEGFKGKGQKLGNWDEIMYVPLSESRTNLWNTIYKKYQNGGVHAKENIKSVYSICITRLTFEFLEFRSFSDVNLYVNDDSAKGTEVYSIIDTHNQNLKTVLETPQGNQEIQLPKDNYNFFNDIDEYSIRKVMDLLYRCPDKDLYYHSNFLNEFWDDKVKLSYEKKFNKFASKFMVKKLLDQHIAEVVEAKKPKVFPWGKVTEEDITAYFDAKSTIRNIWTTSGGLNPIDPLDQEVLRSKARENIQHNKVVAHNQATGVTQKYSPRPSNAYKRSVKLRVCEAAYESRKKLDKSKAVVAAKEVEIAKEKVEKRVAAPLEANLTKTLELDKENTSTDQWAVSEDVGLNLDLSPILDDIYVEPNTEEAQTHFEEFSSVLLGRMEEENWFGLPSRAYQDFMYAPGTDTIEDEDIYSAN